MLSAVHICAHNAKNAGDLYLALSVKKVFERKFGKIKWTDFDIQKLCTESDIDLFNNNDMIIVGGGGHIAINSFYYKKETGWSLGLPNSLLSKIKPPLIGYAIGYNLFRGEVMNNDIFTSNISNILNRFDFFSLRHQGDIEKLKKILPQKRNISFNFCSSLVNDKYDHNNSDKIVFQLAWDATEKRFGTKKNIETFIENINVIAKYFSNEGMKVNLVSHTNRDIPIDLRIFDNWKQSKIHCKYISLVNAEPNKTSDFYYGVNTVFAMRGHSQMIPLGLGCNVVSLISHDKVKCLLEDLNIEKTGVEVNDNDFLKKCFNAYEIAQKTDFNSKLDIVRDNIDDNMSKIKNIIKEI